jgi:hypothetical protein
VLSATTPDDAASNDTTGSGRSTPPEEPSMRFREIPHDESGQATSPPPGTPNPSSVEPSTLGSPDLGDSTAPDNHSPPADAAEAPAQSDQSAQLKWNIAIPNEEPATQERNGILRSIATWLTAALAVAGALDPELEEARAAIEAAVWLAKYLPDILSYLAPPKTLNELQKAVSDPQYGYENHHIVEAQFGSENPLRNSLQFPDRINSPENLVRIPHWKHVEISSWYSRANEELGNVTPPAYLRGKSWEEQYKLGLETLRRFGVLQ